jgi:hypothetical protein
VQETTTARHEGHEKNEGACNREGSQEEEEDSKKDRSVSCLFFVFFVRFVFRSFDPRARPRAFDLWILLAALGVLPSGRKVVDAVRAALAA